MKEEKLTPAEIRWSNGHAWMMCEDCGAKLYDFDGNMDKSMRCPTPNKPPCAPDNRYTNRPFPY